MPSRRSAAKSKLNVLDQGAYYGDAVYGKSPWLDPTWASPTTAIAACRTCSCPRRSMSDGTWNAAHFKNTAYDHLVASYIAALDLEAQQAAAGKIQKLLLDETPVIFGYFYDYLTATKKGVTGVQPTAMGHLLLGKATSSPPGCSRPEQAGSTALAIRQISRLVSSARRSATAVRLCAPCCADGRGSRDARV